MHKNYDDLLAIETDSKGMLTNESTTYNPYEATPYSIIHALFEAYQLDEADVFVDFGCGKGRLLFYVHNLFGSSVTGIEMDKQLYEQTIHNKRKYLQKTKHNDSSINVYCSLAETYKVRADENKFYFFNPFSKEIFQQVIHNIIQSVEQHPRTVDIILYYPRDDYIHYLEETAFQCVQEIKVPGLYNINNSERFLIYRLKNNEKHV